MPYIIPEQDLESKSPLKNKESAVKLTYPQSIIFNCPAKKKVIISGRQIGKTQLIIFEGTYTAASIKNSLTTVVYPTYRLGKRVLWNRLKEATARVKPKVNEVELRVTFPNGSRIEIIGADNPDSLVGLTNHKLLFDEFTLLPNSTAYEKALPTIARYNAPIALFGTPRGYNWAYDIYKATKDINDLNNKAFMLTTAQGGLVTKEALALARETLNEMAYKQEYEASFDTLKGQVYPSFSIANLDDEEEPLIDDIDNEYRQLLVGMDFNINPMSAVLAYEVDGICYVFDEIEITSSNTDEMATHIRERFPNSEIDVSPDPSGASGRTSAGGKTDVSILESYGFDISLPRKNKAPAVRDRINNVNTNLMSASGQVNLIIHPRCKRLINALRGQTYKEGTNIPDKSLVDNRGIGLDHLLDSLGYLLWQKFNLHDAPIDLMGDRLY